MSRLAYRQKLYILLAVAATGYAWLAFNVLHISNSGNASGVTVCLIKQVSGLPCPSCGSTRAILLLLKGDITASIQTNPLGIFVFAALNLFAFLILYELSSRKPVALSFGLRCKQLLRQPVYSIPLALGMAANWVWNIVKAL